MTQSKKPTDNVTEHIRNGYGMSPDKLSTQEQEIWFNWFASHMTKPSSEEVAFFANRRILGLGVTLSQSGALVHQSATKKP